MAVWRAGGGPGRTWRHPGGVETPTAIILAVVAFVLGGLFVLLIVLSRAWGVWLRAKAAGVPVDAGTIMLAVLARRHSEAPHDAWLTAREAGLPQDLAFFAAHHRAGGDVRNLALALVAAHRGGVKLDVPKLAASALAGTDPVEVVRKHLEPEVSYNDPRTFGISVGTAGVLADQAHPLALARLGTSPDFPVFAHQGVIAAGTPVVVHSVHGNHVAVMPMK